MTTIKWTFSIEDKPHEVRLRGSIPKPEIWLDDQVIGNWREFPYKELLHDFNIDGHPATLGIILGLYDPEYFLLVDEKLVEADDKNKKLFGKAASQFLETRQRWMDLGQTYGLEYHPGSDSDGLAYTHRLIGHIHNFLVILHAGKKQSDKVKIPGIFLTLKYAPIDADRIESIKNDQAIYEIFKEWQVMRDFIEIGPTGLVLFMRPILKEDTEEDVFEAFSNFIKALSVYVRPAMEERCESPGCGSSIGQDLQIILMNGMPMFLCQDYAKHITDMGMKAELDYQETPNNLLKGTLYGIAGMLAGILPLLIFPIFFERVYPAIAIIPFAGIIWAMRLAKTKQNIASLLIASLLSMIGSVIGTSLGLMLLWIKQNNWAFDYDFLFKSIQRVIENPKFMKDTINISLVILAVYVSSIWIGIRQEQKHTFHPEVEVIPSFKLH